jgi:hypothetical protein
MRDAVDACLTKAFRDVAVPKGLAERLLAGLTVERPRRHSRRWLLVGGGLAAAAASIALAVSLSWPRGECVSEEMAQEEAIHLFAAGFTHSGVLLDQQAAPAAYPFSSQVGYLPGMSWHGEKLLDYPGVVYDLPGPAGVKAALFVVDCKNVKGLAAAPAASNVFTTGGCCASAWQEDGMLYVLVVQGDRSMYGRYLSPHGPAA